MISQAKTKCFYLKIENAPSWLHGLALRNVGVGMIITYLGYPIGLEISPKQSFEWIFERSLHKIKARATLCLSFVGRVIVLKHVIAIVAMYVASILLVAKSS